MKESRFDAPSREELRMYHTIQKAVGKELANKMFPEVGRYPFRVDATKRRTTGN